MTRPKVPDDKRIRTAQACESCKRRKQKVSLPFFLIFVCCYIMSAHRANHLPLSPARPLSLLFLSYHLCINTSSLDAFVWSRLCMDVFSPDTMRMPLHYPSTSILPSGPVSIL